MQASVVDRKVFSFWSRVYRARDLEDVWVAHCITYDVVTQGNSFEDARAMIREAVSLCLVADLNECGSVQRIEASAEDRAKLHRIIDHGERLTSSPPNPDDFEYAVFTELPIVRLREVAATGEHDAQEPFTLAIAQAA